jgi:acyl carrier protein phosphodiesterase
MPKSSYNFYNYVLQNDIYNAYASIEGIESALFHLSHRIKHGVFLNESLYLFKRHELALLSSFNQFMQDIKIHLTEPNHGFYK